MEGFVPDLEEPYLDRLRPDVPHRAAMVQQPARAELEVDLEDPEPEDLGDDFDSDKFDDLMSSMMAGMKTAVEEEAADEAEAAILTPEVVSEKHIPRLWPGDETRELARANRETDGVLVIITPKSLKDDMKVGAMFAQAAQNPDDARARQKAVWAIDKLMDIETSMKLVAGIETEFGRFDKSEEILEVQDRIHVDITLPVARRLIDEEVRDIRHHLQQHLKHKKNGNFKEGQAAAQQAMKIVSRVAKIATAFATPEQTKELGDMIMQKSAFMSAVQHLPAPAQKTLPAPE